MTQYLWKCLKCAWTWYAYNDQELAHHCTNCGSTNTMICETFTEHN